MYQEMGRGVTYIDKERDIEQTKRQKRIMETGGRRKALGQNNLNKDFHFFFFFVFILNKFLTTCYKSSPAKFLFP